MVAMTSALPAPFFIALHTAEGVLTTNTEQLIPEVAGDVSDPKMVALELLDRITEFGSIRFGDADTVEIVFAHAIHRISVQPEGGGSARID